VVFITMENLVGIALDISMLMADVVISETLCFIANKFSIVTRLQLKSILVGFYSEDELSNAKDALFANAVKLNVEGLPRHVKRAKGDNRVKLIADDLLEMFTCLDEKGCLARLPIYVARNLDRVPSVKLEDMELFCVSQKLESLVKRVSAVESVSSKLDHVMMQLDTQQNGITDMIEKVSVASAVNQRVLRQDPGPACTHEMENEAAQPSLPGESSTAAYEASSDVVSENPWQPVRRRRQPRSAMLPTRLRGCKEATVPGSGVRAVPRESILAAFVSRLHRDTTEEELSTFLTAEGMHGIVCRKLEDKRGRVFRTAAFKVTCCRESESLFYDETHWPAGVELRDWVYKH